MAKKQVEGHNIIFNSLRLKQNANYFFVENSSLERQLKWVGGSIYWIDEQSLWSNINI